MGPVRPTSAQDGGRAALFLDRDGIVNVNHGYVHSPEGTDWLPGIFELCTAAQEAGYLLVVVTNQAGIARGYYDEAQFREYTLWMHAQFQARGITIAATYYCPHHPESGLGEYRCPCQCRKPAAGMLLAAASDLAIDLSASILVGDSVSDIDAAASAGVPLAVLCADAASGSLARLHGLFRPFAQQS